MNECKDCKKLTSDNMCLVGALYGMKRCIRTPKGLNIPPDEEPEITTALDHKRIKCDKIASQLFFNKFDCYLTDDFTKERTIPAMTEKKFREIVGKIIYDKS